MIEFTRAQDEEVEDGTTSYIILTEEMLSVAEPFILKKIHSSIIVNAYYKALEDALKIAEEISQPVDIDNDKDLLKINKSCLSTKFSTKWDNLLSELALKAIKTVWNRDFLVFDYDI
jgi:T-complex protein 1 subunit gamma